MALHPEQVGKDFPPVAKHGHAQPKAFAAETADASGMTKRSINQHLARAEALGGDLEAITGTSLDIGVELDALSKLPEPERKGLIERASRTGSTTQKPFPYQRPYNEKGRS